MFITTPGRWYLVTTFLQRTSERITVNIWNDNVLSSYIKKCFQRHTNIFTVAFFVKQILICLFTCVGYFVRFLLWISLLWCVRMMIYLKKYKGLWHLFILSLSLSLSLSIYLSLSLYLYIILNPIQNIVTNASILTLSYFSIFIQIKKDWQDN